MSERREKTVNEIKNFALNICNWQTVNEDYFHKMSIHIQDVIENFTVTSVIIDNGELKFEGVTDNGDKRIIINENEVKPDELEKILSILKDINFFVS